MDGLSAAGGHGEWWGAGEDAVSLGSGRPCQELQGWVTLASRHWEGLGTGGPETGLSPLTRAHHPLSRPPVKVAAPLWAQGGQREALLRTGKAI